MDRFDKYFEPGLPVRRFASSFPCDQGPRHADAAFKAGEIDFISRLLRDHVDTLRARIRGAQIMTGKGRRRWSR